ncbi:MAG: hypothetical protein CVV42_08840 [Candidatus Riflebacteria bacterium HGW-Riflebacteria-2]|jgi:Icc-related predicted phosphoesterase|nr:MAG: hypothetical protein CVV42_08840 [Candidatus Riflebacteria bacterium HGW-Riflebacteria-2]
MEKEIQGDKTMSFNRRSSFISLVLVCLLIVACLPGFAESVNPFAIGDQLKLKQSGAGTTASASARIAFFDGSDKPARVAVLSDLHVRGDNQKMLDAAVKAVNKLPDVDAVAITGDLCKKIGSPAEYSDMIKVVSRFKMPIYATPGNHDIIYRDHFGAEGKKLRTSPTERKAKLERFRKALKLKKLRFTRKMGGHLLVFLPNDDPKGKHLVTLSTATLNFLKDTLKKNPDVPTIVFCHAPLAGSYVKPRKLGFYNSNAQPHARISAILKKHPQVFLWVSGHLHIGPSSPEYHNKANKVGNVTVIHTPAITPNSSWMRVLDLSPARAKVRTYNAKTGKYTKKFERVFKHKVSKDDKDKKDDKSNNDDKDKNDDKDDADDDDNDIVIEPEDDDIEEGESDIGEDDPTVDYGSDDDANDADSDEEDSDSNSDEVAESDSDQTSSSEASSAAENAKEVIKDLIRVITDFLKGIWNGILKILNV